jgi:hypothetical protein
MPGVTMTLDFEEGVFTATIVYGDRHVCAVSAPEYADCLTALDAAASDALVIILVEM